MTTGADWTNVARDGYWVENYSASSSYNNIPLLEVKVESATANPGYQRAVAFLGGQIRMDFSGNGTITLPKSTYGAAVNYTNSYCTLTAAVHGTLAGGVDPALVNGTNTITCLPVSTDSYILKNLNSLPLATQVTVLGMQPY